MSLISIFANIVVALGKAKNHYAAMILCVDKTKWTFHCVDCIGSVSEHAFESWRERVVPGTIVIFRKKLFGDIVIADVLHESEVSCNYKTHAHKEIKYLDVWSAAHEKLLYKWKSLELGPIRQTVENFQEHVYHFGTGSVAGIFDRGFLRLCVIVAAMLITGWAASANTIFNISAVAEEIGEPTHIRVTESASDKPQIQAPTVAMQITKYNCREMIAAGFEPFNCE